MELKPRRNCVLLKKDIPATTVGRIHLPDVQWSMHQDYVLATVIAVGEDCRDIKVGMRVLVGKFGVIKVDEEHVLIAEKDIAAEVLNEL